MTLTIISFMPMKHKLFRHKGDEPHLLREIVRAHQALMAGFTRSTGMPASRFVLMRLLANSEDGLGVMELADELDINAAAVTRQVKEMEREGLVRRRADSRDGRRNYISLSAKGARLFERIHDRNHELERALVAFLGAENMATAAATLVKLREFIATLERSGQ
jgi:DNA-binding MarR family transcriptional regulator